MITIITIIILSLLSLYRYIIINKTFFIKRNRFLILSQTF